MPEGDTIHRSASALRTALAAKPMLRFDAPRLIGPVPQAGRVVESVESHGKHLEIEWDDGLVLDTHMRMTGSWHLYRRGENWRRPYTQMRAAIEVDDWVAVCFSAPHVETYRRADKRRHPGMGRLGPDLCKAETDLGAVVNLLLTYPDPTARIAEVLLDQRVMCGVGNVYRCEVLWATELSPYAPGRRAQRARCNPRRQHRGAHAAIESAPREPGDGTVGQGRSGCVRTQRAALPSVRRHDRMPPHGRA